MISGLTISFRSGLNFSVYMWEYQVIQFIDQFNSGQIDAIIGGVAVDNGIKWSARTEDIVCLSQFIAPENVVSQIPRIPKGQSRFELN